MLLPDGFNLAARPELLQRILPKYLEHREAGLAARASLLPYEALIYQRGKPFEDIDRASQKSVNV